MVVGFEFAQVLIQFGTIANNLHPVIQLMPI
jgi:hypothetical protein